MGGQHLLTPRSRFWPSAVGGERNASNLAYPLALAGVEFSYQAVDSYRERRPHFLGTTNKDTIGRRLSTSSSKKLAVLSFSRARQQVWCLGVRRSRSGVTDKETNKTLEVVSVRTMLLISRTLDGSIGGYQQRPPRQL